MGSAKCGRLTTQTSTQMTAMTWRGRWGGRPVHKRMAWRAGGPKQGHARRQRGPDGDRWPAGGVHRPSQRRPTEPTLKGTPQTSPASGASAAASSRPPAQPAAEQAARAFERKAPNSSSFCLSGVSSLSASVSASLQRVAGVAGAGQQVGSGTTHRGLQIVGGHDGQAAATRAAACQPAPPAPPQHPTHRILPMAVDAPVPTTTPRARPAVTTVPLNSVLVLSCGAVQVLGGSGQACTAQCTAQPPNKPQHSPGGGPLATQAAHLHPRLGCHTRLQPQPPTQPQHPVPPPCTRPGAAPPAPPPWPPPRGPRPLPRCPTLQ